MLLFSKNGVEFRIPPEYVYAVKRLIPEMAFIASTTKSSRRYYSLRHDDIAICFDYSRAVVEVLPVLMPPGQRVNGIRLP